MKLASMSKEPTWPVGICAGLLMCSLIARAAEPWTLEQALDYARVHNPDARIAVAQAGLEQTKSQRPLIHTCIK